MKNLITLLFLFSSVCTAKAADFKLKYESEYSNNIEIERNKTYSFQVTDIPKDNNVYWYVNDKYINSEYDNSNRKSPSFETSFGSSDSCYIMVGGAKYTWYVSIKNEAPAAPSNPNPYDGKEDVSIDPDFSWSCSDPDGDDITYTFRYKKGIAGNWTEDTTSNKSYSLNNLEFDKDYYWKVVAEDEHGASTKSHAYVNNGWKFTTEINNAPAVPSNPNPYDGKEKVSIDPDFSWSCSDPDGDDITYTFRYKKGIAGNWTEDTTSNKSYSLNNLEFDKDYYWKVVAEDEHGASTKSHAYANNGWKFTTEINNAPAVPSNPNPYDGKEKVSIDPDFSWSCSDPDGDDITYTFRYKKGIAGNWTEDTTSNKSYSLNNLEFDKDYYWKVVAEDEHGASTKSHAYANNGWKFTTEINNAPAVPSNPNPYDGKEKVSIDPDFSWSCSDPDGDDITYTFRYKKGIAGNWTEDTTSNKSYSLNNLEFDKDYYWKVVAEDEHGASTKSHAYANNGWKFTTEEAPEVLSAQWLDAANESIEDNTLSSCETVYLQIKTSYEEGAKFNLVIKERDQFILNKDDYVTTIPVEVNNEGIARGIWTTIYLYKQPEETSTKSAKVGLPDNDRHPDYFFEVQETSDNKSLLESGYIEVIDYDAPIVTTLIAPENGTTFETESSYFDVKLEWNELIPEDCKAAIKYYKIEVANDASFNDIIEEDVISGTDKTLKNISIGTYYWRVAARNEIGYPLEWNEANWSETRQFDIQYSSTEDVLIITPEDDGISTEETTPLLLVHGWQLIGMPADYGGGVWNNFKTFYTQDTENKYGEDLKNVYKIYTVEYKSNLISVEELGRLFREKVDEMKLENITIIAHSMGGLVSRAFMESSVNGGSKGGELVNKLITLGTPHHGSPMANGPVRMSFNDSNLSKRINNADLLLFGHFLDAPAHDQHNRSDLHWDNFDLLFNEDKNAYQKEKNDWLIALNSQTSYDDKIIAYAGIWNGINHISDNNFAYSAGNKVMSEMGLRRVNPFITLNDGIVPLSSALYMNHIVEENTRILSPYNHTRLVKGNDGETDKLFSRYLKADLLNILFSEMVILPGESLTFENTQVNNSSTATFTLRNNGSKRINVSSIDIGGTNASEFKIISSTIFQIQPGKSVELSVQFSPETEGDKIAMLNIQHDANDGQETISISGYSNALTKVLGITPDDHSMYFGTVSLEETGHQLLKLSNSGNSDLSISDIILDGDDVNEFEIQDNLSFPITIPTGETVEISITFTPTSEGNKSTLLVIYNDSDNKGTETTILLNGTGLVGELKYLETTPGYFLDFGQVSAGESETKSITLENSGNTAFSVSEIDIEENDSGEFSWTSTNTTPFEILAGDNQIIDVTFSPVFSGSKNASIKIYNDSDNEGSVKIITLYGEVEIPTFIITTNTVPDNGGTVSGYGEYKLGEVCTLTAIPETGYKFVNWSEKDTLFSIDQNISFEVKNNRTLIANFEDVNGIVEIEDSDINIYPNPTKGCIVISGHNISEIEISNLCGQLIKHIKTNSNEITIDLTGQEKGIYIFKLRRNNDIITRKVILK